MINPQSLYNIIGDEIVNWLLWLVIVFVGGVLYYLSFEKSFDYYLYYFLVFFIVGIGGLCLNRSFCLLVVCVFLGGAFYAKSYHYFFLDFIKIDGKVFVNGTARVLEVKKSSLVLVDLELCRSEFISKVHKSKETKVRKSTIVNNYLNLPNYQEIDREFIDKKDSYMDVSWVRKSGKDYLPNVPKKIILSLKNNKNCCDVNDVIKFRALLNEKEEDDFVHYNQYHKVGAFGFLIGEIEIVKKGKIDRVGQYFLSLREKIDNDLDQISDVDTRSIIKAILIGKRDEINPDLQDKIRRSGLAHLLAISGLHLSIVAGMFFMLSRIILVRFERFSLHYDTKKIAVWVAIMASVFYLNISGQGVSVQRAFLMILFGFVAVLMDEKPNFRHMVFLVLLCLVVFNPYIIFMVGFQLSFIAVISVILVGEFWQERFRENVTSKFSSYFILIVSTSFLIQILTAPILIKNFGFVSLISIIANLVAIPFLSFVIMPFVFFLLFLMPFGIEEYLFGILLKLMGVFLRIVEISSSFKYSAISLPFLFDDFLVFLLFFACLGLFLAINHMRYLFAMMILAVFVLGFFVKFFEQKDDIIWDKKNKFFALYDQNLGLIFSKKLRNKRLQNALMRKYREDELKILGENEFNSKKFTKINCDMNRCEIEVLRGRDVGRVLILLKRNKVEFCNKGYDKIINLNSKYLNYDCGDAKNS